MGGKKRTKFYIEVYLPRLGGWFPAHTYVDFPDQESAKAKFLEMNPMYLPEHVRLVAE